MTSIILVFVTLSLFAVVSCLLTPSIIPRLIHPSPLVPISHPYLSLFLLTQVPFLLLFSSFFVLQRFFFSFSLFFIFFPHKTYLRTIQILCHLYFPFLLVSGLSPIPLLDEIKPTNINIHVSFISFQSLQVKVSFIVNSIIPFPNSETRQVCERRSRTKNDMAEEHRCQAPEGHRLCANNCGFFGSPATMNLCSKCHRDLRLKEQQEASTKSTIKTALSSSPAAPSSGSPVLPAVESPAPPPMLTLPEVAVDASISAVASSGPEAATLPPNRCGSCRKRVGLTGFKCKCGATFCGTHRYPEKHGCSFDFKKVGREGIARANPLIKAKKLERI